MGFDTMKYPGFWKHLVVGVCSSAITVAATAFALGGAWGDQKAKIKSNTEEISKHQATDGLHPTLTQAAKAEGRLRALETQQQAIVDDVAEIKGDIKDVKRLLERRDP